MSIYSSSQHLAENSFAMRRARFFLGVQRAWHWRQVLDHRARIQNKSVAVGRQGQAMDQRPLPPMAPSLQNRPCIGIFFCHSLKAVPAVGLYRFVVATHGSTTYDRTVCKKIEAEPVACMVQSQSRYYHDDTRNHHHHHQHYRCVLHWLHGVRLAFIRHCIDDAAVDTTAAATCNMVDIFLIYATRWHRWLDSVVIVRLYECADAGEAGLKVNI